MKICKNCKADVHQKYCPHCGISAELPRINGQYIINEVAQVFNFNKGILFTIREMVLRPGVSIRRYFHIDRNSLIKPTLFIIICSLMYSITQEFITGDSLSKNTETVNIDSSTSLLVDQLFDWIEKNFGYTLIFISVIISFWVKIFFKKSAYNFYEILMLVFFTMGICTIGETIDEAIVHFTSLEIPYFSFLTLFLYPSYAVCGLLDDHKLINYIKAILAHLLAYISFILIITLTVYALKLI